MQALKVVQEVAEESMIKAATEIVEKTKSLIRYCKMWHICGWHLTAKRLYIYEWLVTSLSALAMYKESGFASVKTKTKGLSGKGKLTG
ncbi:hypothetical protein TNCV_476031 [Trichonephila clavipes]|nr:hypothetical protein TNCV_476031 [Trichonephila clavipes]